MIKLFTFFLLFLMPFASYAYDDEDEDTMFGTEEPSVLKSVIDVSQYKPSPISIRKSILKIVVKNNWVITKQTKNLILAEYKTGAKMKVTIQPAGIIIEEVKSGARFTKRWMVSLESNFIKNIVLEHHIDVAKAQLNIE